MYLDEIIDALEWVDADTQAFLNTETGETVMWMEYGDNDIDEDDDFSLFSAMTKTENSEEHDAQTLFNAPAAKPSETNPLSELMEDGGGSISQ